MIRTVSSEWVAENAVAPQLALEAIPHRLRYAHAFTSSHLVGDDASRVQSWLRQAEQSAGNALRGDRGALGRLAGHLQALLNWSSNVEIDFDLLYEPLLPRQK